MSLRIARSLFSRSRGDPVGRIRPAGLRVRPRARLASAGAAARRPARRSAQLLPGPRAPRIARRGGSAARPGLLRRRRAARASASRWSESPSSASACSQPISKRVSAQWQRSAAAAAASGPARTARPAPRARPLQPVVARARVAGEAEWKRLPGALVEPPPCRRAKRGGARLEQPQRRQQLPEAESRRGQRRRFLRRSLDGQEDERVGLRRRRGPAPKPPRAAPRSSRRARARDPTRDPSAPRRAGRPERRQDGRHDRVVVNDRLELARTRGRSARRRTRTCSRPRRARARNSRRTASERSRSEVGAYVSRRARAGRPTCASSLDSASRPDT